MLQSKMFALLAISILGGTAAFAADVTVKITGIKNENGQAIVYLWKVPGEGFPSKTEKAETSKTLPIKGTSLTAVFNDVAPGTYAISVTHDENKNSKMDTGFMGKPKEGYGASNNPQNKMSAPSFDQCKITVDASGKTVDIALRY
jgi:uncharacterized protein (DUF2141 family)